MSYFLKGFVQFILGLIELVLIARFALRLFAANPASSFVAWVYETSQPLVAPFLLAFPAPTVRGGFVLEFTTLFALFVYAFIGYLLIEVLDSMSAVRTKRRD